MNKPFPSPDLDLWTTPETEGASRAVGYDAALDADLVQGVADLDAGRSFSLDAIRKEFGAA